MDESDYADEVMCTDMYGASMSRPEAQEVSLESEIMKPSSTEELKGMLQRAGTELTVKYLTGKISFEDFTKALEQSKAETESSLGQKTSQPTPQEEEDLSALPNFELMMDQDYSGDEEEVDDEEEKPEEDDDYNREYLESMASEDGKDEDWVPGGKARKGDKVKGKKKVSKPQGKEKQPEVPMDLKKRPYKRRRRLFDLPKIMQGTNGKAMLLRAQGNMDEAIELFFEVIKHAPRAAAPYEALGSIHEERGNLRQAVKFYMVAANLRGRFATEWLDIVDMCRKLDDDKLVMTCFVKGLIAAATNEGKLRILAKKSAYLSEIGSHIKSLQAREQMLPHLDRDDPSSTLTFARDLVQDYLEAKDANGAISTLQFMTKEYPNDIDSEDIHSLVELYIDQKNFLQGLETIIKHCGVTASFSGGGTESPDLTTSLQKFANKESTLQSLNFPALMPIDLRSKLVQCLVRMKILPNLDVLKDLIDSITSMDADDYGDVHYDIAEIMVVCYYHQTARPILEALVRSEKYNEAAVWLTLGQCLNALGDLRAAIAAYRQVVDMAPGHHGARVTLASLLQQMGQNEVALQVLSTGSVEGGEQGDQEILLHKCQLLHSQGKSDEFITSGLRLLSFNLPGQFNPDMVKSFMSMKTIKSRKKAAVPTSLMNQEPEPTDNPAENKTGKGMSLADRLKFQENFWDIFVKLCRTLKEKGMNDKLLETAAQGVTCPVFNWDSAASKRVEFLSLKAGPVNENVYHVARNLALENITTPQAWNLYNYILTRSKGTYMDLRFTVRCLMKNPDSIPLSMLNGNERLISGTYTQAIAEYIAVFKKQPDNDLALFCSALCLLHIASHCHVNRKNSLILQIAGLLNAYREMRGDCQETYYNIGRAWNQLNIQFAAVHYYKKALEYPPVVDDGEGTFDMSREIAYNLSRIYLRSKSPDYARYYIEKYCVI